MFINRRKGELNLKLVYYGPALSGKTTNLEYIHQHTNPQMRGELVSLKTREDRTVFFDYLMLDLGKIAGLRPKFSLYTVPGQVYYAVSRKLVLQGADGIVFVADSQRERLKANLLGLQDMAKYMREMGLSPARVPIIVQFNKRDLDDILSTAELRRRLGLDRTDFPCIEASALYGEGVFKTLKTGIQAVIRQVQRHFKHSEMQRAPAS
ncbi:MAG: GTP-binding protein [Anaerolineae bacterium]